MELLAETKSLTAADTANVAVVVEHKNGEVASVVPEMLAKARELATALGEQLQAIILGGSVDAVATEIQHYGVDKVYTVEDPALENLQDDAAAAALEAVIAEAKPSILLAGATQTGRSFIPRVAARYGVGIIAGCTNLAIQEGDKQFIATRPAFGGTVFAEAIWKDQRPQVATVRRKVFDPAEKQDSPSGEVVSVAMPADFTGAKVRFLESVDELAGSVDLTEADVIVSGGRGIGGPEGFTMLRELADAMGGALGASRAAVDAGWIAYSHQVGQTGKAVRPKMYVACGISGAIQHLVGMRASDVIIAINRDPEAPIFKVANYGLVGDVKQIVPALTKKFQG